MGHGDNLIAVEGIIECGPPVKIGHRIAQLSKKLPTVTLWLSSVQSEKHYRATLAQRGTRPL
jgi:hypothetical protein